MKPGDTLGLVFAEPAMIRLGFYSVDGNCIAVLRAGRMSAGRHQVHLDPALLWGIPRRPYLLDLRAGDRHWSVGLFLER